MDILLKKLSINDNSYNVASEIYNTIYKDATTLSTVKETEEPIFIGGKPVQLDNDNFMYLTDNDYYISTKADGERYLFLITNKKEGLTMFLINGSDKKINFWEIYINSRNITTYFNHNNINNINCLLDGELIINGTQIIDNENIKIKNGSILYLAFDILYGPTKPDIKANKEIFLDSFPIELTKIDYNEYRQLAARELEYGSSNAMFGIKAEKLWPTYERRRILETIFKYESSSLYNEFVNSFSIHQSFALLVSPFEKIDNMLNEKKTDVQYYNYMINFLHNGLNKQYKNYSNKTLTIKTDGLIFTPVNKSYQIKTWFICNNIQYKWKPINELTIDFKVGKKQDNNNYEALVDIKDKTDNFRIDKNKTYIYSENKLVENSIVETYIHKDLTYSQGIFMFKKNRNDKYKSNGIITILSILNAYKLDNILTLVYDLRNDISVNINKVKNLLNDMNKYNKQKLITNIYLKNNLYREQFFTKTLYQNVSNMIIDALKNNLEFELRTKIYNYRFISYILDAFKHKLDKREIIRIYGNNSYRIECFRMDNSHNLTVSNVEEKQEIKKEKFDNLFFSDTFFHLSREKILEEDDNIDISKIINIKNNKIMNGTLYDKIEYYINNNEILDAKYVYQNRYKIPCELFDIYIIENGFSNKKWELAKENLNNGPFEHNSKNYQIRLEFELKNKNANKFEINDKFVYYILLSLIKLLIHVSNVIK